MCILGVSWEESVIILEVIAEYEFSYWVDGIKECLKMCYNKLYVKLRLLNY